VALLLVGIGLTALQNLHGPPLLACACIGGVMLWRDESQPNYDW
jgi:hypothetical protein